MKNNQFKLLLTLQLATLFLVAMLYLKKETPSRPLGKKPAVSAKGKPIAGTHHSISPGNNCVYGDENAPNELIVFSRYNCYHCSNFYNTVVDSLKNTAVAEGKLKLIFIDNVNPKDDNGMFLAKLGEIARQNNKYEEAQKILYNSAEKDSLELFNQLASLGIPKNEIKKSLNNKQLKKTILKDNKIGDKIRVSGTPTMLINGEKYLGYQNCNKILSLLKN